MIGAACSADVRSQVYVSVLLADLPCVKPVGKTKTVDLLQRGARPTQSCKTRRLLHLHQS